MFEAKKEFEDLEHRNLKNLKSLAKEMHKLLQEVFLKFNSILISKLVAFIYLSR